MEANKTNVFETYNKIANWYEKNHYQGVMQKEYLDKIIEYIGNDGTVLDLGCGTGLPVMNYLHSKGIKVTGVDASYRMLEIARTNLPEGDFLQEDMRTLSLDRKFDAVIAWNSFFHLPAKDQPLMFDVFRNHLNTDGILLFTSGTEHGEAWGINGGEQLYHASLSSKAYRRLLEEHEFKILKYTENDESCGGATVWMAQLT